MTDDWSGAARKGRRFASCSGRLGSWIMAGGQCATPSAGAAANDAAAETSATAITRPRLDTACGLDKQIIMALGRFSSLLRRKAEAEAAAKSADVLAVHEHRRREESRATQIAPSELGRGSQQQQLQGFPASKRVTLPKAF
ncbi:hypothetical protein DHEL01_v200086 [Diaporthe helianthi]|uniref:Uncharacterized protein n=1 Tax=Diaporthe helianthi TaxID=158607 RepID=A0A2P5IG98_DIAHE|nr:hypothetical protein DHEL01_v200086 [Diaporthe helianthi]